MFYRPLNWQIGHSGSPTFYMIFNEIKVLNNICSGSLISLPDSRSNWQKQGAVTAYLTSKLLLPRGFPRGFMPLL